MDGFFSKKEYAQRPATRLTTKLRLLLCLECSIWQVFFRNSIINFITARFRNRSLSVRCSIPELLAFFFCLVIHSTPFSRSPTNSFPKKFFVRDFMTLLLRSFTLPGVRSRRTCGAFALLRNPHKNLVLLYPMAVTHLML